VRTASAAPSFSIAKDPIRCVASGRENPFFWTGCRAADLDEHRASRSRSLLETTFACGARKTSAASPSARTRCVHHPFVLLLAGFSLSFAQSCTILIGLNGATPTCLTSILIHLPSIHLPPLLWSLYSSMTRLPPLLSCKHHHADLQAQILLTASAQPLGEGHV